MNSAQKIAQLIIYDCEAMASTLAEINEDHKLCAFEFDMVLVPEGREQVEKLFSSRFAPKSADIRHPHTDDIIHCLRGLLLALSVAVMMEKMRWGFYKPY